MKIRIYRTRWPICDNVVISAWEDFTQVGIVELMIFKGEHERGGYIGNLHVNAERRGKGYGRTLLKAATNIAKNSGCKTATLGWSIGEYQKWVFDWYTRNGFEERGFGRDCAFMEKELKGNSV